MSRQNRGKPISLFDVLSVVDNSRRVIYCDLADYIAREPNFISTLCECGVEMCMLLHRNNEQSDFDVDANNQHY